MSASLNGIARMLDAELRPVGLGRRKRFTWLRRSGDLVDVVNLQRSNAGDRVWVNLGVADPDAYAACWGKPMQEFVDEAECTVRARLGMLIENLDVSWEIVDPLAGTQIVQTLTRYGLPFLERMHALPEMEAYLARRPRAAPDAMALAIVRWKDGKKREACEGLASDTRRGVGAWQDRVDSVARHIGCR